MHTAYLTVTIAAALACATAAALNFAGAQYVKDVADRIDVSQAWMVPFGTLLASGATGLLLGFAVPGVGIAAAIGLVLYFLCAVSAHLLAGDHDLGGAVFFLLLAAGALGTALAEHEPW